MNSKVFKRIVAPIFACQLAVARTDGSTCAFYIGGVAGAWRLSGLWERAKGFMIEIRIGGFVDAVDDVVRLSEIT